MGDVRLATIVRVLALNAAVVLAYVVSAQLGFRLAFVAEQVTTVWAPTGIAMAALLIAGVRVWPAIWVGAWIANAGTTAPLWTAFVIATGNTLESVTAVWWLRKRPDFDFSFRRVPDALNFILIAALTCTAISATLGVATLWTAGVQPLERLPRLWVDWWLGDALGALVVAPVILTAVSQRWSWRDGAHVTLWMTAAAITAHIVFGQTLMARPQPVAYFMFPVVIGAAIAGGTLLTTPVALGASIVTIWHTVGGSGPFAGRGVQDSLTLLQAFMGVLAATALLLGAAITERRATEQREREAAAALRHRDDMLRLAQRAGGVATFVWDFQHQSSRCSAEFFRILGLPEEDGAMTAAEWRAFVHPDDRDWMATHLERAIAGIEPAAADYRVTAADASIRWLSYAGRVEKTPEGVRLLGTVVDITDRKRLEAELRHHVAEVEHILESTGEGFVALDPDFRFVYVNPRAEEMLGLSRAALAGRTPWEIFPAASVREPRRRLEAIKQSGVPAQFAMHVPIWNRWFENRVYPSAAGLTIFCADVTARIEAEAALRENQDVLSLAMRGGSMGAWSRNLASNEVWWSPELEEIFGVQPGEFNRTEAGFFALIHDDDRPVVRTAVDDAVRHQSDYIVEFRFRHASGQWRWMEGRGRAVYADDRSPRSLYGIGIDVTERKRTEIALREAKIVAESANELKDQFLATLSHELRTPLNAILGYARMLKTNAIAPDKRQRAVDVIERNAVAQNQLVEDLLDMSRITTGKVRLDPKPVPAVTVLREAVEGIKPGADAKGIVLELDFDPFAGMIKADTTRLQQVFWNVLTNAVKFTGDGGRILATLGRRGAHVEIGITDTGAGIAPEFLPFVFEPFRQAESRFDRAHGGLGLGLAITKQLVELHGGTIRATSPGVGQGATFVVQLPCVDAALVDEEERSDASCVGGVEQPALLPSLLGRNILLVDDEEDTLTLFRDALEDAGATVRAALSGQSAVRAIENWRPDLLVTDLGLPGMDGYQLLREIRSLPVFADCPAVAVSGYARLDDRSRVLAAGFQAHVAKPIDPAELVLALRRVLSSLEERV